MMQSIVLGHRTSFAQRRSSPAFPASGPQQRPRRVRCCAVEIEGPPQTSSPLSSVPRSIDHYQAAGQRLQALLSGVGDGEDELMQNLLAEEAPEQKLQTSVVFGGAITVGAIIVSTLLGKDPWGGASISLHSLQAAAIGAAAAVPFVAFRAWSWTPAAAKAVPALEDMHFGQLEFQKPWLTKLNESHVVTMMALEVLPLTLLLFPAAQNGLVAAFGLYNQLLHGMGLQVNPEQMGAVALFVVALLSGLGRSVELSVSAEQYEMVRSAAANADRYYRTMASANAHQPEDAAQAADAFRLVAQTWIQTKEGASAMAGVLTTIDVIALGLLWNWTGDLTSTAVAALAINYVDVYHMHQSVMKQERKGSGPSSI